jgi:integrase/recombinase XerC
MVINWLNDFFRYLKFEKRYSANTVTAYQKDLEQFFDFCASSYDISEATEISHFHIRTWLASLKDEQQKARTINRKLSSLNSFYKFLLRKQLVTKNPVRQMHAMRLPERLPAYLKEQETETLLGETEFSDDFKGRTERLICELLYQTGIRRSELIGLKDGDVEWSLNQIRVLGKGNKERLIPVNSVLLDSIRDYISTRNEQFEMGTATLLVTESGEPIYAGFVYRTVNKYLAQVTTNPKKSPHIMRHTFATHLLNNGANIQAIKELLGHSSLAATQVYAHNNIEKLKEIHKLNHPRG